MVRNVIRGRTGRILVKVKVMIIDRGLKLR